MDQLPVFSIHPPDAEPPKTPPTSLLLELVSGEVSIYGQPFTFPKIVALASHIVEVYSVRHKMHGESKLQLAKNILPDIIREAVRQKLLGEEAGEQLLAYLPTAITVIEDLIDTFVAIGNNPKFIQLKRKIRGCCVKPVSR